MTAFMYAFCTLVWGLNFIAVKIQGEAVPLDVSLTYRLWLTFALFAATAMLTRRRLIVGTRDLAFVTLFGLCNFAISYLLLYHATLRGSAALTTLVFSLKTVLTPIALRVFLRDRLARRILVGGLFGILGILVLLLPSLLVSRMDFDGLALAVAGTIVTAIGDVASARNARRGVDPVSANCLGFLVAAITMTTACVAGGSGFVFSTSPTYVGALLYLTLAASYLAWLFYLSLIGRIGAAGAGQMVAVFPVIGGIASVAMGESEPTAFLVVGCLLSCLGAAHALGLTARLRRRPA